MDFNTIETPSQLVEQNNQSNSEEDRVVDLIDSLLAEGPKVGLATAKIIIEKLVDMHESALAENIEDGNMEMALLWQEDLVKLQTVTNLMEDVVV